jgi:hypothetical protein
MFSDGVRIGMRVMTSEVLGMQQAEPVDVSEQLAPEYICDGSRGD